MRRGNFFDAAASAVELSWSLGQKRELDERRLLSLFSVTAFNNAFTAIVRVMTLQTSYYTFTDMYITFGAGMSIPSTARSGSTSTSALVRGGFWKRGRQCKANFFLRNCVPI